MDPGVEEGDCMRRIACITVLALCVLVLAAAAGPATAATADELLQYEHAPGRLLVKFQPGTEMSLRLAVHGRIGAEVVTRFRLDYDLDLVKVPETVPLKDALDYYLRLPEVKYAEPDYIYHTQQLIPNDPRFPELWGMHNTGQSGGLVEFDIDAPDAWESHTDAPAVVIGSIDTGVDRDHEDLNVNIWRNPGEVAGNGVDDDGNGYVDDVYGYDFVNNDPDPRDDHDHGSHTMGTAAAAGNNGIGVTGVTWSAQIMSVKVCNAFGSCPSSAIIQGIDYSTENGADVTNNSYGGGGFSQAMKDAIERANQAGILFVAAAGNNGNNNDAFPFYPASYDNENIIAVASVDRFGQKSSFSNYGATTVDLGAPGSSILSTARNNTYKTFSGTSMATPHVAGAVAYLMGFNPTLGHLDYKQIILDSVEPTEALQGITVTGGTLNLKQALDLTPPLDIPPENEPPVADPNGPYKGRAFRPIVFDGSGSFDPNEPGGTGTNLDDQVTLYIWDFGDGTRVTTSSPTVEHTYGAGNADYVVTLMVKDKFRVSSAPATTTCRIRGGGKKPPKNP